MDPGVVDLSRLQFALTALYHFLFVPLTLGLSFMLVIMEAVYVMTDRPIWRVITRFWSKLFAINFVLGVATGLTMEFQFGTNWSYFSHYVGDIFGAPLAIEGLMAFFLEATFVGLMFFGWNKMSKLAHLGVTFMDGVVSLAGSGAAAALQKAILMAGNVMGVSEVKLDGAQAATVDDGTQYYIIKSGDTLSAIAKQFYGDPNQYPKIFDANREVIKDANLIFPGQKIRIPKA